MRLQHQIVGSFCTPALTKDWLEITSNVSKGNWIKLIPRATSGYIIRG